jgi:hypothetical protein
MRARRSAPKASPPNLGEIEVEEGRAEDPPVEIAGTVAIVGYPNVG